jgi:hypothetical protein
MESADAKMVRGQGSTIEAVVTALEKSGVEITQDGVRYIKPPRR